MNKEDTIIIVGAGLAGLTSAAYLSREGYNVQLLEQSDICGGLITSFSRDGFVFDTGARSIENSGVVKPLLKDLGIEIELLDSKVSLGIEKDILSMSGSEDIKKYKALLISKFPENINDIDKIFEVIKKITKSMKVIYGFDNPIFKKDFTHDKKYLIHELMPWFGKFILAVMHMNRINKPINDFLKKYTSNQALIDMISQHFFKKTPTFFALGYFYVYQEYLYPKGGTGELTKKLSEKVIENGAKIKKNTLIKYIDPQNKILVDNKGNKYNYSKLIWAADLKNLYSITDFDQLDTKNKLKCLKQKELFDSNRGGDSVFSLYLGIDKPLSYFEKISHGHFLYTPQSKGLANTNTKELNNILNNFDKLSKEEIINWANKYCSLNTIEISIPSLRDPQLSPDGKTGLIANIFFEYDLVKKIKDANWYKEFKEIVENKLIEILQSTIYPEIKNKILFQFSFSPLSYNSKVKTSEGAITGWTYERKVPVVHSIQKIPKSVKTAIPDIYQVGQWAYSPAGIPTAILTGWYGADAIMK
jgi:phytoene dehydrogenase-like protein